MSLYPLQLKFRVFLVCLLLLLAACDLPTRSIIHHEQAIDSDRNLISDGEEELQFPHHLLRLGSEGDDPHFVVNEYRSFLIDRDQLIAQYKTNQEETRELINNWYENVLEIENNESEVEFVIESLLYNCTVEANDCPLLPVLTSSPLFALVLEKWVKIHENNLESADKVKRFYTVLHLYLERRSRDVNNTILFAYLKNIRSLETLFSSERGERIALVDRQTFNELTAEVLEIFLENGSEEEITRLVQQLNVFNLTRAELRDPLSRLIFQKGLELGLYIDGQVNPEVTNSIESRRNEPDSFESRLREISSSHSLMITNLDLDVSIQRNEYFWIVDALFYNRLGIDEISWIWQASQKSLQEFNNISYEYLKIQLAHLILSTNKSQARVFSDETIAKSEVIEEAIRVSELSTVKVLGFLTRVDRIRGFSESTGALREIEGLDNRGVKAFFNYLKENIKFLISYNHHLMAIYYISKRQIESRVRIGGVSATTKKYESMIRTFRDNHLRKFPLLFKYGVTTDNYSAGEKKLNFYQLAYVFDFALKTLSFDQLGIDPFDYIKVFYEIVVESRLQMLLDLENWSIHRHDDNSFYQEFLSLCQAAQGDGGYSSQVKITDFSIKPTLGVFTRAITRQTTSNGQVALNPYSLQMAEELEAYKLIILRDIQFADALVSNLRNHFATRLNLDSADIESKLAPVNRLRTNALNQLNSYLEGVSRLSQNYDECYLDLVTKDKDVMVSIMSNEIAHIKKVHQAMTEIRSGQSPDLSFTRFSDYPNSYRGYDEITGEHFLYHKMDLLIRAKEHMEELIDYARVKIPTDFTRDDVTRNLYTNRENQRISYVPDVDEFVKKVLRTTDNYVLWLKAGHMNSMIFPLRDTYQNWINYQRIMNHLGQTDRIPEHLKPESIVDYIARFRKYYEMSDETKEILRYFERDTLLEIGNESSLIDIMLNDESLEPEPYFYWLLYVSSFERIGSWIVWPSSDVTSQGSIDDAPLKRIDTIDYPHVFEDALEYSKIQNQAEHNKFVFPVSEHLRAQLDEMVKKRVQAETRTFDDILGAVKDFECRDKSLPTNHPDKMVYEFEIGQPLFEYYADYNRWPGRFFRGQRSFNRRTSDFYVETTPQIDITPPTCSLE